MWIIKAILAWEFGWWVVGKIDRRRLFAQARRLADASGKPLLVVGEPMGEYPCGDVTVDIAETSKCPVYVKASVEDLRVFRNKQFGAVFASHVVEHVCSPQKATAELSRVADHVLIAYPRWWRIATYLVPGHVWLPVQTPAGLEFRPLRKPTYCNHPTRYGRA